VVALANTAESEDQARFLTDAVDFLAKYHQTQTPLVRLIAERTIVGRDRAGTLVVPAEADYVVWTGVWRTLRICPIWPHRSEAYGSRGGCRHWQRRISNPSAGRSTKIADS
jgi:hypothetical protein